MKPDIQNFIVHILLLYIYLNINMNEMNEADMI